MKITTPTGTYLDLRDFYVNGDDHPPTINWLPQGSDEDEVGVFITFIEAGKTLAEIFTDIDEFME